MEERFGRLDAAREALALRQDEAAAKAPDGKTAKRNGPQAVDSKANGEMADLALSIISET